MDELLEPLTIFLLLESGVIFIMTIKRKLGFSEYYVLLLTTFLSVGVIIALSPIVADVKGYFLSALASMLGVYSAFALQNWGEERKKKALTKKILEALLYDLSSNIKALDKLQDSNIFPIFSVVNWKNWENRIELDDIHIQGKMCNLFDYFKDINDVIKDKPQVKKLWIDYMKKDVSNLKEELNNLIKYIREYYKREYNEDILTDKNSIMENKSQ